MEHYNEIKNISLCEFWAPHLVIYLDSPAEEVQKKLKASGKVCFMITFVLPMVTVCVQEHGTNTVYSFPNLCVVIYSHL